MATMYYVFRAHQGEGDEVWLPIGQVEGTTPRSAIKHATDGRTTAERTGTFVACPARSWQPVTRRVEAAEKEIWE